MVESQLATGTGSHHFLVIDAHTAVSASALSQSGQILEPVCIADRDCAGTPAMQSSPLSVAAASPGVRVHAVGDSGSLDDLEGRQNARVPVGAYSSEVAVHRASQHEPFSAPPGACRGRTAPCAALQPARHQ